MVRNAKKLDVHLASGVETVTNVVRNSAQLGIVTPRRECAPVHQESMAPLVISPVQREPLERCAQRPALLSVPIRIAITKVVIQR